MEAGCCGPLGRPLSSPLWGEDLLTLHGGWGLLGGDTHRGHIKLLKVGTHHRSSCQEDLPSRLGGVGVPVEGEWGLSWTVGSVPLAGGQGLEGRVRGAIVSLCLCVSCLLGGVHLAAAPVLDPEAECSMDIILVDSSELSSPPSPEPHRGEGSCGYWTLHLGCQPQT